jgi:phosphate transport system protein
MQPSAHSSSDFDADLVAIRSKVLEAGGVVERQIRHAIGALRAGDTVMISRVIADEDRVNRFERDIDESCARIIARRAPAASDLRVVMMLHKMITDLERIGDEAKKIALFAKHVRLNQCTRPGLAAIEMISAVVIDMLGRSLDALARLEAESAPEIARLDREVDDSFKSILRELLTHMVEDPRTISPALDLVFVAKALERIGDHAKNIAEYVVYMIKGRDVRHLPIEEMAQVAEA